MRVQETGAALGKGIKVRGLRHGMTSNVSDPVVLIVDRDKEDVGLFGLRDRVDGRKGDGQNRDADRSMPGSL
jgi:hypothetical protein